MWILHFKAAAQSIEQDQVIGLLDRKLNLKGERLDRVKNLRVEVVERARSAGGEKMLKQETLA